MTSRLSSSTKRATSRNRFVQTCAGAAEPLDDLLEAGRLAQPG